MSARASWLVIALLISLGGNVYLLLERFVDAQLPPAAETRMSGLSPVPPLSPPSSESSEEDVDRPQPALTDITPDNLNVWLNGARTILAQGQGQTLLPAVQRYLRRFPDDTAMLLFEAEVLATTQPVNSILMHYYQLLDLPLDDAQRAWVEARIDERVQSTLDNLREIRAWDILATLLEPLWQAEPDRRQYILHLAEAYAHLDLAAPMENVLASMLPDDPRARRIRSILNQTPDGSVPSIASPLSESQAPLIRRGDHFVVSSIISDQPVALLVDTGASTTVLSARAFSTVARDRNTRYLGHFLVNTAGGQVEAPLYHMRYLAIGDKRVDNIAVMVMPLESFDQADGLLGMNFLREFDFRIDQVNARLRFH